LIGGYCGRPLIADKGEPAPISEEVSDLEETPDVALSDDEREAQKAILMDTLVNEIRHFQGEEDAPVTIIEFSDFQCPYCGDWSAETGKEIKETYVEEGLVRIGYWHFPFLGNPSVMAAEASECAGEQDAFWAYHDYLFSPEMGGKGLSEENLKEFAAALELDTEAFNECLDSGKHRQFVQGQRGIAQQIGVSSTPSFLINGEPVIGAQKFPVFQEVIEGELSGKSE
jgi:protein-disulfide isomerase